MQQLLNLMGDLKVGIVVITGDSYVAVPLDDYKKNKEAIDDFVRTKEWGNKWTSIGVALYRARVMLERRKLACNEEENGNEADPPKSSSDEAMRLLGALTSKMSPQAVHRNSTADSKNIIIFSDGDKDICAYDSYTEDCPQWKKDNITAHSQKSEARAVHKLGIKITFVSVDSGKSHPRVVTIAGKPENIVEIDSYTVSY
ncbi:hypothetical protein OESDEN_06035 [Oesophagostomum dentatum]|uniref:VWFA domain-containing protein n=1 Tax=Oesophagostomum dentatum TaxID=61180 RepID=A0A0B1T902_OESDE|nr:hypothetical protein OESDEN_06035 [Oesophagostomum dentatum]